MGKIFDLTFFGRQRLVAAACFLYVPRKPTCTCEKRKKSRHLLCLLFCGLITADVGDPYRIRTDVKGV